MYQFSVLKSIAETSSKDWSSIRAKQGFFMSYEYLQTLEVASPQMGFRYVMAYNELGELVGISSFQLVDFSGEHLRKYVPNTNFLLKWFLNKGLDLIHSKLLVLGNIIFTCEPGWVISNAIEETEQQKLLLQMIDFAAKEFKKNTIGIMISEELTRENQCPFFRKGFHMFEVEDKMVFKNTHFHNADAYKSRLNAKYRTRMNKIYKLNEKVVELNIDYQNYAIYENDIQRLFKNVLENSKFKLLDLDADYFKVFLNSQPNTFRIKGYLLNHQLVGFISYFEFKGDIEVHYLGMDYLVNKTHKLYNYLLYRMVYLGIETQKKQVCLSRTAQEIKSTVGAEPVKVFSYLKVTNWLINWLTPFFLSKLKPEPWEQRYIWSEK